jgi:hypothetical protein
MGQTFFSSASDILFISVLNDGEPLAKVHPGRQQIDA